MKRANCFRKVSSMANVFIRFLPLLSITATLAVVFALRGASFVLLLCLLALFVFTLLHIRTFRYLVFFLPLTFSLYYVNSHIHLTKLSTDFEEGKASMRGVIHSSPVIDGDRFQTLFKSETGETVLIRYTIQTEEEKEALQAFFPGDVCIVTGRLEPFLAPTNFYQFDYRRYMNEANIFWTFRPDAFKIDCKRRVSYRYMIERWRYLQMQKLSEHVDEGLAGIMIALLFGERRVIDEDVLDAYRRLGVVHLLAVSGLHVGMVSAALFYVMIRIGITRERAYEMLIALLPFYALMTGAAPPVVRAVFMAIVVLVILRSRTRYSPLYGLIIIYMIYLLARPFTLFHLGFQLSFLLTFTLIVSASTIQKLSPWKQTVAITVLCQLFSLPLLLYHTYEISWLSLPLNLIYIPFIALFVLPGCWLAYILSFFLSPAFNLPLLLLTNIVPFVHRCLVEFATMKWATIITGKPHPLMIVAFYVILIYGAICFEKGRNDWWKKPLVLFVGLFIVQLTHPYLDPHAKVTMVDVGQGDCFLIELPFRQAVYVIDTGGTIDFRDEWRRRKREFDVAKDVVVPALKARGIGSIDRLILTHGDADHVGGVYSLSRYIRIQKVLYGVGGQDGEEEKNLFAFFQRENIRVQFVKEGDRWKVGRASFIVLSPTGAEKTRNERSIVLFAEIEGVTFLFTGDIEAETEHRLVRDYPKLVIDVLKVAHHGSRTSTGARFLEHVSPKIALISVGRNNRFGHPHSEVLERLEERNIAVFRSDEGSIRFVIRRQKVRIDKAIK